LVFQNERGAKIERKTFRRDKKNILGGHIYKYTYFKLNFKTFGGTGPPLVIPAGEVRNKVTYNANLIGGASSGKACGIDTLR
jgi:hypothetical protein